MLVHAFGKIFAKLSHIAVWVALQDASVSHQASLTIAQPTFFFPSKFPNIPRTIDCHCGRCFSPLLFALPLTRHTLFFRRGNPEVPNSRPLQLRTRAPRHLRRYPFLRGRIFRSVLGNYVPFCNISFSIGDYFNTPSVFSHITGK